MVHNMNDVSRTLNWWLLRVQESASAGLVSFTDVLYMEIDMD